MELDALKQENEILMKKTKMLTLELVDMRDHLEACNSETNSLKKKLQQMEQEGYNMRMKIEELAKINMQLEEKVLKKEAVADELKCQNYSLQNNILQLQEKLEHLSKDPSARSEPQAQGAGNGAELAELRKRLAIKEADMRSIMEKMEEMEMMLVRREKDLKLRMEHSQVELEDNLNSMRKLEQMVAELEREVSVLYDENAKLKEMQAKYRMQLEQKEVECEMLQREIGALEMRKVIVSDPPAAIQEKPEKQGKSLQVIPAAFERDEELRKFVHAMRQEQLESIAYDALVALRKMPPRWITWKVMGSDLLKLVSPVTRVLNDVTVWNFKVKFEGQTLNGKPHGKGTVSGKNKEGGTVRGGEMSFTDGVVDGRCFYATSSGSSSEKRVFEHDVLFENGEEHGFDLSYCTSGASTSEASLSASCHGRLHGVRLDWTTDQYAGKVVELREYREGACKFEKQLPADAFKPWTSSGGKSLIKRTGDADDSYATVE